MLFRCFADTLSFSTSFVLHTIKRCGFGGCNCVAVVCWLLSGYIIFISMSFRCNNRSVSTYIHFFDVSNSIRYLLQLSFGPIGWLMISEIFPLRLRGRGMSISVFINFATNALVTFAFSPIEVR